MAIRLLTTSATLSTSAGSWKKAETANFTLNTRSTAYDDVNTARYSAASNPTVGVSLQGVYLFFAVVTGTGTFTVTLQENTGSWGDVAGTANTFNVSTLSTGAGYLYAAFAAPYTATANQFRIKVSCDTASRVYWWRSTTAGDYSYALIGDGDDVTKIGSGDTALIDKNVVLTMDENLTLAATNGVSMILGDGSSFLAPPPAAGITLALGAGKVQTGTNFIWRVGTDDTDPITSTEQFTLTTSLAASSNLFELPYFYYDKAVATVHRGNFEWWGQRSEVLRLKVASDANDSQNVVNTVEDIPVAWADGDIVTFAGKDNQLADAVTYYSKKTGAKQISLFTSATLLTAKNLDVKLLAGGAVVNLTEGTRNLGIQITSTNQTTLAGLSTTGVTYSAVGKMAFEGANMTNCAFSLPDTAGLTTTAGSVKSVLSHYNAADVSGGVSFAWYYVPTYSGGTLDNVVILNDVVGYAVYVFYGLAAAYSRITTRGVSFGTALIDGTSNTMSDVIIHGVYGGDSYDTHIKGSGHTVTDLTVIGGRVHIICNGSSFLRFKQQRSSSVGLHISNAVANTFTDSTIGVGSTNTGSDIDFEAFSFSQNIFINSSVGSLGVSSNYSAIAPKSFIRFQKYNTTADDHRNWETNGTLVSTGFGLSDTTVWNGTAFAAAASGQLGYKIRPNHATNELVVQDNFPNTTTIGNCQNLAVQVSLRIKMNHANFYAGTHTKPTLTVKMDGVTIGTPAVAAGNTNAQQLIVNFTPTTTTGDITITLEAATDATGTDADVYVGELMVLKPGGISTDTTRFAMWSNGLPLGTNRTFPAPQSVWDAPTANHQTAGSFGAVNDVQSPTAVEVRQEMDSNSVKLDDAATGTLIQ